jgi:hypothetical protein
LVVRSTVAQVSRSLIADVIGKYYS